MGVGRITYGFRIGFTLAAILLVVDNAHADGDDFGMLYTLTAQKKFNKKASMEFETEFRTRNDSRTFDRLAVGIDADYKIAKWLKVSAGYQWLYYNNREKITFNPDGNYNNWRPSYYGSKHRWHADITGSYKLQRVEFSLRERYQLTYRPEATTDRYDFDNEWWEETSVREKTKHTFRSRLKLEYDIPKCKFTPFASAEIFNEPGIVKSRFAAGVDYSLLKKHEFSIYYRYQHINENDDENEDRNRHYIGLGYKFKF